MKEISRGRRFIYITAIIAGFLLVVANSAFWANRYVFNQTRFAEVTVQTLTSEDSRVAIADAVTETIYRDRPITRTVLAGPTGEILQNMLQSQPAESAMRRTAAALHSAMTSKQKQTISLDLTSIKSVLSIIAGVSGGRVSESFDPANIPDRIVLFDSSKLPNLYAYAATAPIVGMVSMLCAVALLAVPYIRSMWAWQRIVRIQGLVVTAAGLLALSTGPIFRPAVTGLISEATQRTVTTDLYNAFVATFNTQTMYVVAIGILMILAPWIYQAVSYIAQWSATKISQTPKPALRK